MILTCDDQPDGGFVFQLRLSKSDLKKVRFDPVEAEESGSVHECLRILSEYAESLENAWRDKCPG